MQEFILSHLPKDELETLVFNQVRKALAEVHPAKADLFKEDLLTIDKAAEMLSVSVPTIYGYVHQRNIPVMKRRGRLYFSKSELLSWIKSGRQMTRDEIRRAAEESLIR